MSSDLINIFKTAKNLQETDKKAAENKYSDFIRAVESLEYNFEKEYNLKQDLASAYNNRGYLKYLAVDFDQASEDYTKCLKINPNFTVAYYNRGMIHYRLGRFDEAIEDLSHTLKLDPCFEQAKIGLDRSLQEKEEQSERRKMGYFDS